MLLRVDLGSTQPLHEQLAGQLRAAIASGDPAAGEKLPPARDLAESLGVNVHTLLRAFKTLRDEGLLEVRRGRGTIVTDAAAQQAHFVDLARELVTESRRSGLTDDEIRALLEAQL
ncbi:MAG: GntR family transcriptional regulator [Acidimicrobiia bacterium]|nr:GntR family transcriptional regulator [Acidimicrobiia bacterium]